MTLTKIFSVSYPSPTPVDTQFVFVGVLEDGDRFYFVPHLESRLSLKMNSSYFQAWDRTFDVKKDFPVGFENKRVVFMAKFTRVGIACNAISLEDYNAHSFTFTQKKSFTFLTVGFYPDPLRGKTLQIEFFGLVEGGNLASLYKFLMEEKFRE